MISCSKCAKFDTCIKTGGMMDMGCEYGELKLITNADRIRAMTDEELSKYLDDVQKYNIVPEPICAVKCEDCKAFDCQNCWFNWLKQEDSET